MGGRPISGKEIRFVEEFLLVGDVRIAGKRAGYSAERAQKLLMEPGPVRTAIQEGRAARAERAGVNAQWVLNQLVDLFQADVLDITDPDGDLLPVREWPPVWRKLLAQIDVQVLSETESEGGTKKKAKVIRAKFLDKLQVLEMIGKHVDIGAFSPQIAAGIQQTNIGELKVTFVGAPHPELANSPGPALIEGQQGA